MAFQNGYVVGIKDGNNKTIREFNEGGLRTARIPFGTEYKIGLKNKTNKRCYVEVEIDGMKVDSEGRRLVFSPGQELDLERFVDSMNHGNKFKFVEAGNSEVQDPTSAANGRIKVTFYPEYIFGLGSTITTNRYYHSYPQWILGGGQFHSNIMGASGVTAVNNSGVQGMAGNTTSAAFNAANCSNATNAYHIHSGVEGVAKDAGATVSGGISDQKFNETSESFYTDTPVVIELQLRGPNKERNWHFNTNAYGQVDAIFHRNNSISGWTQAFTVNEPAGQFLVVKIPMNQTVSTST